MSQSLPHHSTLKNDSYIFNTQQILIGISLWFRVTCSTTKPSLWVCDQGWKWTQMSYQHLSRYCCGILWYPCLYHRLHLQLSNFWKFSRHKKSCFDITSKISFLCSFEFKTWMSKGNTTKPSPSIISGCPNRERHCSLHFQVTILQMEPWLRGSGLCMASVQFGPVSALAFLTLFFSANFLKARQKKQFLVWLLSWSGNLVLEWMTISFKNTLPGQASYPMGSFQKV